MRSIALITLLALLVQAHVKDRVASRNSSTRDSMDKLVDKFVEKLIDRTRETWPGTWPLHQTDLDDTTLGKPAHLTSPSLTSVRPLNARPLFHGTSISPVPHSSSSLPANPAANRERFAAVAKIAAAMEAAGAAQESEGSRKTVARAASTGAGTTLPEVDPATTRAFRKAFIREPLNMRMGKTQMDSAMNQLKSISGSDLLTTIREAGFRYTIGDVTFVLAESYGFCWGVERSVAMAYEARNHFADKTIWVTNEIIHNPDVNQKLKELGMRFIHKAEDGEKDFSVVGEGDVVILPAFGATVNEMAFLKERKVHIVDTTCPWVIKVWNSVEKNKEVEATSIIHGTYSHEETVATKSFADKYLVVRDMAEAEYVADYILNGGDKEAFLKRFEGRMSPGFDPDEDLKKVGVANQTTMLKGETELIGKLFERTMIQRYGPEFINDHFKSFNTICDATDERQDAMYKMFGKAYKAPPSKLLGELEEKQGSVSLLSDKNQEKLSSKEQEAASRGGAGSSEAGQGSIDMVLVVGGFNSANTAHLLEIVEEEGIPGFHVDGFERIGAPGEELSSTTVTNQIESKPMTTTAQDAVKGKGLHVTKGFLPDGPVTIGVTSGASTPDRAVEECLKRILAAKGVALPS